MTWVWYTCTLHNFIYYQEFLSPKLLSVKFPFFLTAVPLKITQHPESKSVATGASTTFTVEVTGYGCHFHWKKNGKVLHEGSKYHGTKTDTLQIKDVDGSDEGSYQCLVKNAANEVLSKKAELAVSKLVVKCR